MMVRQYLLPLILSVLCLPAQAQLYKWIGPDGKVNYSDTPPPPSVKQVETKNFSTDSSDSVLPYELSQASKSMPVVLYTMDKCQACDAGRNFLKQNGIPFTEKTVNNQPSIDKFQQISGSSQLPLLYIGRSKLEGFESGQWRSNLSDAGYPNSNLLPSSYRFPAPQPLVPVAIAPQPIDAQGQARQAQPEPPARDPNGFQF